MFNGLVISFSSEFPHPAIRLSSISAANFKHTQSGKHAKFSEQGFQLAKSMPPV